MWFLATARQLLDRGLAVSVITQPDSVWLPQLTAAGIPHATIPLRCDGAPWTWFKLARYFHHHKITAILANRTKDLKACAVAGRLAGVPVIFGTRESDFPLKDKLYYRWYFNSLANGLLVNSEATRRTILTSAPWLHEERVHLLYKGIDTVAFSPAISPPEQRVVGFVGQLIERKGLRDLMVAWSQLDKRDWPAGQRPRLRIAGEGPLATELQHWQIGLIHPAQVELVGYCRNMPEFYHKLSLLVMPSYQEGFGLAAAEASACGLPVIASDASSLPEIVIHGSTGLLISPADPNTLAAAMAKLVLDPVLCQAMGQAGRARVGQRFDLEKSLDRLQHLTMKGPSL